MAKRVITKELDSELMVYDPDQDAVHVLNATALLVYRLYNQGKEPAEIAHEIEQRFAIGQERDIVAEIRECIAELQSKGLLSSG
jgi:hypothetical protein